MRAVGGLNGCRRRVARSRLGRIVGGRVRCSREPYAEPPAALRPPQPPSCQPVGERRPAPGRVAAPRRPQTGSWAGRRMQLPAHVCTFVQSVRRVVHVQDNRLDDDFVSSFQPCADKHICIYISCNSVFRSSFTFFKSYLCLAASAFQPKKKRFFVSRLNRAHRHELPAMRRRIYIYIHIYIYRLIHASLLICVFSHHIIAWLHHHSSPFKNV